MPELRHQILIKAAPAKVYAAIATPEGLGKNLGPHWKE